MAPGKTRQRALARAKLERQIARRAAAARRRRQIQAWVGVGLAVVLVAVGITRLAGGFSPSRKKAAAAEQCAWTPLAAASGIKDVGKPPTSGIPTSGTSSMTITTNLGQIDATLDRAGAPCTVASFTYLAGKQFFNNTKCHRLTTDRIYVLQCGDPSGTGSGGPAYKFPDEKMPTPAASTGTNLYPAGTLAMANSGTDTNGSQFFIVYKDNSALEAKYTVFGKVTKGLDLVQKVAAAGVASGGSSATDGPPKTAVTVQSLTVTPDATQPTTAPSS